MLVEVAGLAGMVYIGARPGTNGPGYIRESVGTCMNGLYSCKNMGPMSRSILVEVLGPAFMVYIGYIGARTGHNAPGYIGGSSVGTCLSSLYWCKNLGPMSRSILVEALGPACRA